MYLEGSGFDLDWERELVLWDTRDRKGFKIGRADDLRPEIQDTAVIEPWIWIDDPEIRKATIQFHREMEVCIEAEAVRTVCGAGRSADECFARRPRWVAAHVVRAMEENMGRLLSVAIALGLLGCESSGNLDGETSVVVESVNVAEATVQAGDVQAGAVAAGDVSAGDVVAGDVAAGDVVAGDVLAEGAVTASGAISAGDVIASGAVSATGPVSVAEVPLELTMPATGSLGVPVANVEVVVADFCLVGSLGSENACPGFINPSTGAYELGGAQLSAAWTAALQSACAGGTIAATFPVNMTHGSSSTFHSVAVIVDCP